VLWPCSFPRLLAWILFKLKIAGNFVLSQRRDSYSRKPLKITYSVLQNPDRKSSYGGKQEREIPETLQNTPPLSADAA